MSELTSLKNHIFLLGAFNPDRKRYDVLVAMSWRVFLRYFMLSLCKYRILHQPHFQAFSFFEKKLNVSVAFQCDQSVSYVVYTVRDIVIGFNIWALVFSDMLFSVYILL